MTINYFHVAGFFELKLILNHFSCNISSESLHQLVAESDLSILSKEIALNSEIVLGLTKQEREEACRSCTSRKTIQKLQIIKTWKKKKAEHATYNDLIKDACEHQQIYVAKKVREILLKGMTFENETVGIYREHLFECYTENLRPSSSHQWPEFHHEFYVDQVFYTKKAKEIDIVPLKLENKTKEADAIPLKLENIFDEHAVKGISRKVILIEGVAGSGKTTLLWHICKQWALGKLFNQFSLMIHISLNNRALNEVKCLADVIPHLDQSLKHTVAEHIINTKGRNVCFILDGCDEAPDSLWEGFLGNFLRDTSMLPQCTFLLASRPSTKVHRYRIMRSREILLKGCVSDDVFKIILQNDTEKRERIDHLLEMNPNLRALCDLPINAIILIFIHEMVNEDNMPKTRTDLFNLMLCNFMVRHVRLRTEHEERSIRSLDSDLPSDVEHSLGKICLLAYNVSISSKREMTYNELRELGMEKPDENLGLLEITRDVTVYGPEDYYSFPHLSIQEFLAALHIKKMRNDSKWDENKEASAIKNFLNEDPLNPIITFHAGLTKLKNEKIRILLLKVADLENFTMFDHVTSKSNDTRRLILTLLNCMYECQDEDLAREFNPEEEFFFHKYLYPQIPKSERGYNYKAISFRCLTLYPSDCLSIGYFARFILQKKEKNLIFEITLAHCNINSLCIEAFSKEIKKVSEPVDSCIKLDLTGNFLSTTSSNRVISSLKTFLTEPPHVIDTLGLSVNVLDIPATLKSIIEALANGSSLKILNIEFYGFNYTHIHYLILLLRLDRLGGLHLSGSDLGCVMPLLSEAVRLSKQLHTLYLYHCNIDDEGLNSLAQAIKKSNSLIELDIMHNQKITVSGVHKFLETISICKLDRVCIDKYLFDKYNRILTHDINFLRKFLNIPELIVEFSWDERLMQSLTSIHPDVIQR